MVKVHLTRLFLVSFPLLSPGCITTKAVFSPTSLYVFEDVGLRTQQNSCVFISSAPTLRAANKRPVPTFPDMCPLSVLSLPHRHNTLINLERKTIKSEGAAFVHNSNIHSASGALRNWFWWTLCLAVTFSRPVQSLINQCSSFCHAETVQHHTLLIGHYSNSQELQQNLLCRSLMPGSDPRHWVS